MEAKLSLIELLTSAQLTDPRRAQGKRHPLAAILALLTIAMLSGISTQQGAIEFGNARGRDFLLLLGFRKRRAPSKATICRVIAMVDAVEFEALIRRWINMRVGSKQFDHVALDGKTARGSHDGELPAIHLLTAYAPEVQSTLAQMRVDAKTNEYKAALEMLDFIPLKGMIVTADAMFTHRDICRKVKDRGGDYILPVKDNQPNLKHDIQAVFETPDAELSPPPGQAKGEVDRLRDVA